jgi:hypothetical protein
MADTDFTDADLIVIRRAIASGERSVQFADRMVVYRSMQELREAEARIVAALTARPRQSLAYANKGF